MRPDNPSNTDAAYKFLDPHDFDCLLIIVPNTQHKTSIVIRVLRRGEVLAILLVFSLFGLTRILINWSRNRNVISHMFNAFAMCLAHKKVRVGNRREIVWTVGLLVFSVTSTATLSAVLYQKLMTDQPSEPIRTMEDLANSDLTIYVAELFYELGSWSEMIE